MFTGLIEEIGDVRHAGRDGDGYTISIAADAALDGLKVGDSMAVDGACLTVTGSDAASFTVGLAPETLSRTNLGELRSGDAVQLERALLPTTRLGGHYVQGHVDGTGTIRNIRPDKDALWLTIAAPKSLMQYIVAKGYIAIDGASLTVVNVGPDWFDVTIVAYSRTKLALPKKSVGKHVNLETDILAKYVEKLLAPAMRSEPAAICAPFLITRGAH